MASGWLVVDGKRVYQAGAELTAKRVHTDLGVMTKVNAGRRDRILFCTPEEFEEHWARVQAGHVVELRSGQAVWEEHAATRSPVPAPRRR